MAPDTHEAWDAIVRQGAYAGAGMAGFAHVLTEEDSTAVHGYVVAATEAAIAFCRSEYRRNYPELLDTACTRGEIVTEQ